MICCGLNTNVSGSLELMFAINVKFVKLLLLLRFANRQSVARL